MAPNSAFDYAWDYPAARDKRIVLTVNGSRREVDIMEIGDLVPFKSAVSAPRFYNAHVLTPLYLVRPGNTYCVVGRPGRRPQAGPTYQQLHCRTELVQTEASEHDLLGPAGLDEQQPGRI